MDRRTFIVLPLLCVLTAVGAVYAQSPSERVVGEVVGLEGSQLRIKVVDGELLTLQFSSRLRLSARSAGSLDLLVPGAYVGTTAVPQADATLRALEVHVFPESMRGTGEGHRPMDSTPGATMTNATVGSVARGKGSEQDGSSTMTNAVVSKLAGDGAERRMTLTYEGGEKTVIVPPGTPIVKVEPADWSLLTPGAHVVAYASRHADGTFTVERLTVGKNGFVPPL